MIFLQFEKANTCKLGHHTNGIDTSMGSILFHEDTFFFEIYYICRCRKRFYRCTQKFEYPAAAKMSIETRLR